MGSPRRVSAMVPPDVGERITRVLQAHRTRAVLVGDGVAGTDDGTFRARGGSGTVPLRVIRAESTASNAGSDSGGGAMPAGVPVSPVAVAPSVAAISAPVMTPSAAPPPWNVDSPSGNQADASSDVVPQYSEWVGPDDIARSASKADFDIIRQASRHSSGSFGHASSLGNRMHVHMQRPSEGGQSPVRLSTALCACRW
jgi:hypothetical protein